MTIDAATTSPPVTTDVAPVYEHATAPQGDAVGSLEADIGRWYWATRGASWPLRRLWLNIALEHPANVPDRGGVILAANHLSFLDSVVLMYSLPRRVSFLGKVEYLDAWATRKLFPAAGMIPVDRSGRGVRQSLDVAARRLDRGEIVGIFPEGTRSATGALYRGRTGVARLAMRTGAPIVPVGIIGTDRAQPRGAAVPRPGARITVRFGSPVDLGPWRTGERSRTAVREITDEVMVAIKGLSGQPYFDRPSPTSPRTRTRTSPPA